MKGLRAGLALLLLLTACGRKEPSEGVSPPASPLTAPLPPWSWHPVGSLAVVEGEVPEPTELILEGRSIREHRFAEQGPVRWEFFRPPPGESAVLRTDDGRVLARFEFSLPTERPKVTRETSRLAQRPEPLAVATPEAAPRPIPEPPAPKTHAETRLGNLPVQAIPKRKPLALPAPMTEGPVPWHSAEASLRRPLLLPAPLPEPPLAKTRAEARLQNLPVQAIPERKPLALPAPIPEGPAPRPPADASLRRQPLLSTALPEPPPPKTRAEARLRDLPVTPIPDRKTPAMPSAAATPIELSRRASTLVPVLAEPAVPRPATPLPPPVSLAAPVPLKGAPSAWPGMGEALNLTRAPGGQKRILLSFDGGSSAEVATEVLDLLKARGVQTTLFLTGAFIQRYPALVKRMAAEGHEIGNHTMNHPHFAPGMKRDPKWTRERVQRELLEADAALVRLLGRPMDPYWRAPYGEHTAEIRRWAEELGYRHVGWSEGADTLDWATSKDRRLYRTGDAIVQRLQQRLGRDGDGLIVLMHLGSARELGDRPTAGLGAFMDRARMEGWTFVSAGTILRDLGKPVWNPHQRLALLSGSLPQGR